MAAGIGDASESILFIVGIFKRLMKNSKGGFAVFSGNLIIEPFKLFIADISLLHLSSV